MLKTERIDNFIVVIVKDNVNLISDKNTEIYIKY